MDKLSFPLSCTPEYPICVWFRHKSNILFSKWLFKQIAYMETVKSYFFGFVPHSGSTPPCLLSLTSLVLPFSPLHLSSAFSSSSLTSPLQWFAALLYKSPWIHLCARHCLKQKSLMPCAYVWLMCSDVCSCFPDW